MQPLVLGGRRKQYVLERIDKPNRTIVRVDAEFVAQSALGQTSSPAYKSLPAYVRAAAEKILNKEEI